MKTVFKIVGASAVVAGAYLYSRKEPPQEFVERAKLTFNDRKKKAADWKTAYDDFKKSMDAFTAQIPVLEKTIDDISRDVDEAMFKIQPRLDEINNYTDKLKWAKYEYLFKFLRSLYKRARLCYYYRERLLCRRILLGMDVFLYEKMANRFSRHYDEFYSRSLWQQNCCND